MSELEDKVEQPGKEHAEAAKRAKKNERDVRKVMRREERREAVQAVVQGVKDFANTVVEVPKGVAGAIKSDFAEIKDRFIARKEAASQREETYQQYLSQNQSQTDAIVRDIERDEAGNIVSEIVSIKTENGLLIRSWEPNVDARGDEIKDYGVRTYTGLFPNKNGELVYTHSTERLDIFMQTYRGYMKADKEYSVVSDICEKTPFGFKQDYESTQPVIFLGEANMTKVDSARGQYFDEQLKILKEQGAQETVNEFVPEGSIELLPVDPAQ